MKSRDEEIPHSNSEEPLVPVRATPSRTPPAVEKTPGVNPDNPPADYQTGVGITTAALRDRRGPRPPDVAVGHVSDYAAAAGRR
jgi:hypothetical protein